MINLFYTFFIEASQHILNHWIAGSRQVLALLGAGGRRRSTLAVVGPVPAGGAITVSEGQRRVLEALVRRSSAPQRLVRRAQIILMLAAGKTFNQVVRALGVLRQAVYKWYNRWRTQARQLAEVEAQERSDQGLSNRLAGLLLDAYRPGKPATFSPEQIVKLIAVACEPPQHSGRPVTRWSSRELAAEVVKRGIVKTIVRSTVSRLLKEAKIKPHLSRYWANGSPQRGAAPYRGRLFDPHQANRCPSAAGPVAVYRRQPQHPSIRFFGRMGRAPVWYRGGPRRQGQPRYPQVQGKPGRLFSRSEPPDPLCLYPQAYLLAHSGRALV